MVSSNRESVESFIQAGNDGDTDTIVELTHPNCTVSVPSSLPYGGTYEGEQAFLEVFATVYDSWSTFDIDLNRLLADGDHVVAMYDTTMIPPDGNSELEMPLLECYTIEDDQIVDAQVFYHDTERALHMLE